MRALRTLRFCATTCVDALDVSISRALEVKNIDPRLVRVLHAVRRHPEKVEDILHLNTHAFRVVPPPPKESKPVKLPDESSSSSSSSKCNKRASGSGVERDPIPHFQTHWNTTQINQGLRNGAFEGVLKVSAFHTDRAFVMRRDGTSVRVLGFIGRNRAMNGDSVVAVIHQKETEEAKETKVDSPKVEVKFNEAKRKTIEATISILRDLPDRRMKIILLGEAIKSAKEPGRGSLVALLKQCPEIDLSVIDEQLYAVLNEPEPLLPPVEADCTCKIVAITQRVHKGIVCQIKGSQVQPRDSRLPAFDISGAELTTIDNDLVVVQFEDWLINSFTPKGRIVDVLGPQGDAMTEADAIASWYEFVPQEHSAEMEREALTEQADDMERKDLRSLRVFTVDPPHAKDLDDALSVELLPNGSVRVGVHIADVTHYVKPGGLVDDEARKRLVTLYLVNKVYPMLPRCLSDDLCSLLPNVDRNAFSVFYVINKDGTLSKSGREFTKSLIHSQRRWSYQEVDDALASRKNDDDIIKDLRLLQKATQQRRKTRLKSGGVSLSSRAELRFELNDSGSPVGIVPTRKEESPSHQLIEELMVLCNHVVAKALLRGQGGLLRQHDEAEKGPAIILSLLGDDIPPEDIPRTTRGLLDWVESSKPEAYEAICFATLQDQGFEPAKYAVLKKKQKHWALNLSTYLHFTSPIRRYADVVVHRMLQDQLLNRRPAKSERQNLNTIADDCNLKKRKAFDASTDSMLWHFGEYLRLHHHDGLRADVVITKLVVSPDGEHKPSVELYVPLVGQMKSVALEHLDLTAEEAKNLPLLVPRSALIVPSTDKSRNWTIRGLK